MDDDDDFYEGTKAVDRGYFLCLRRRKVKGKMLMAMRICGTQK